MFGIGAAVVERRRFRLCIARYVFAKAELKVFGILKDVEACLNPRSGLDGYLIAYTYAMARIRYAHPEAPTLVDDPSRSHTGSSAAVSGFPP